MDQKLSSLAYKTNLMFCPSKKPKFSESENLWLNKKATKLSSDGKVRFSVFDCIYHTLHMERTKLAIKISLNRRNVEKTHHVSMPYTGLF